MKAITFDSYGPPDALHLAEIDRPAVGAGDVLVRVRAAGANPYDWHSLRGEPYIGRLLSGLHRPKGYGMGADLAGVVEAVGPNVTRFAPSDEVFGEVNGEVPGQPLLELGSFAEYVSAKEDNLEPKPTNLTFEEAAAVPMAAFTALQGLRDRGRIQPGQKVLINGASGGVGTFAVQIAKAFGAEVTGVCSTRNVAMVRSLGADRVIDYTREDFTRSGQRYDLMLDTIGNRSLFACRRVLTPRGTYVATGGGKGCWLGPAAHLLRTLLLSPFVSQKMLPLAAQRNQEDLHLLRKWLAAGTIRPVIDRSYPLRDVPEALRYLEAGHAQGKVVITI